MSDFHDPIVNTAHSNDYGSQSILLHAIPDAAWLAGSGTAPVIEFFFKCRSRVLCNQFATIVKTSA
jgi:hypothetical protein